MTRASLGQKTSPRKSAATPQGCAHVGRQAELPLEHLVLGLAVERGEADRDALVGLPHGERPH